MPRDYWEPKEKRGRRRRRKLPPEEKADYLWRPLPEKPHIPPYLYTYASATKPVRRRRPNPYGYIIQGAMQPHAFSQTAGMPYQTSAAARRAAMLAAQRMHRQGDDRRFDVYVTKEGRGEKIFKQRYSYPNPGEPWYRRPAQPRRPKLTKQFKWNAAFTRHLHLLGAQDYNIDWYTANYFYNQGLTPERAAKRYANKFKNPRRRRTRNMPVPPTTFQAQYMPTNSAVPIDAFGYAAPQGYPNPCGGRRRRKKNVGRRRRTAWSRLVKKYGVKRASKMYKRKKRANPKRRRKSLRGRRKTVRRKPARGRRKTRRKTRNSKPRRSWKALVKKYGVRGASKRYKKRA